MNKGLILAFSSILSCTPLKDKDFRFHSTNSSQLNEQGLDLVLPSLILLRTFPVASLRALRSLIYSSIAGEDEILILILLLYFKTFY